MTLRAALARPSLLLAGAGVMGALAAPLIFASPGSQHPGGKDELDVRPPNALLGNRGLLVRGTPLNRCFVNPRGGVCTSVAPPSSTPGRLPVRPGGIVVIDTRLRARRVGFQLFRLLPDGPEYLPVKRGRAARKRAGRQRWRFALPHRLTGATHLDISVTYTRKRGHANFWAGIRPDPP